MDRFLQSADRRWIALLPDCLDDDVSSGSPVHVVNAFMDELDLTTSASPA